MIEKPDHGESLMRRSNAKLGFEVFKLRLLYSTIASKIKGTFNSLARISNKKVHRTRNKELVAVLPNGQHRDSNGKGFGYCSCRPRWSRRYKVWLIAKTCIDGYCTNR